MALTTAGLVNGGLTTHFAIVYDDALPGGVILANGLVANCEKDFALMAGWFAGVDFIYDFPLPVEIVNDTGGASWDTPSNLQVTFGASPTITIKPLIGGSSTVNI